MYTSENRQLLERFVAGLCTKEQLRAVDLLLGCEAGRKMLDEIIEAREVAELESPPAPDAAMRQWVRTKQPVMQRRIAAHERRSRALSRRGVLRRSNVAAVVTGVVVLAGVALWRGGDGVGLFDGGAAMEMAELSNPGGVPAHHLLSDGTQVWLAAGSTLKYPKKFARKQRDIELHGEAFFDVARDERRLFTIRTGDMETQVLGTSFKITAFEEHEHEVAVATGKVSVSRGGEELALLTRGVSVRHNPSTGETIRAKVDPQTLEQWKSGVLFFDKLPMGLVVEQLESRFGVEIIFADPQIASRKVRGVFPPEKSVKDILDILGIAGDFKHTATDERYYTVYK